MGGGLEKGGEWGFDVVKGKKNTLIDGCLTDFLLLLGFQWLNNKEMYFTLRAEQILVEMSRKVLTLEQELRAQVDQKRKLQRARVEDEEDDDDDDDQKEDPDGDGSPGPGEHFDIILRLLFFLPRQVSA